ncbi:MAG: V-type ATP synthase subunit K [Coriobacteriia bacterium]|nr:V-type ATP synthase subunit K [Coriobacteriia bacterium]
MISKRFSKYAFWGTFLAIVLIPLAAFANEAEAATAAVVTTGAGIKTIGAALAMGLSAIGAGYAQAKIGSAGQGTLAERPEERVFVLVLTALPEVIALLGFVMAIILNG